MQCYYVVVFIFQLCQQEWQYCNCLGMDVVYQDDVFLLMVDDCYCFFENGIWVVFEIVFGVDVDVYDDGVVVGEC